MSRKPPFQFGLGSMLTAVVALAALAASWRLITVYLTTGKDPPAGQCLAVLLMWDFALVWLLWRYGF
jgi:hypothetical protein